MNHILCITDTIEEPDIYDIETMRRPPYTLHRIWTNIKGEIRRMKFIRLYPRVKRNKQGEIVSLTIADKYYETSL